MAKDKRVTLLPEEPVDWLRGVAKLHDNDNCPVDAALFRGIADLLVSKDAEIEQLRDDASRDRRALVRFMQTATAERVSDLECELESRDDEIKRLQSTEGKDTMNIKRISTIEDYEAALRRVGKLMDAEAELEVLSIVVADYERREFPTEYPTPMEAIKFRMDQRGLKQVDLVPYLGSRSKVSEVLAGKRTLSLAMIRKLHFGLGIPAEVLIREERKP